MKGQNSVAKNIGKNHYNKPKSVKNLRPDRLRAVIKTIADRFGKDFFGKRFVRYRS